MPRFDQQILEALAGPLNPNLFEECACDLLRAVFPGLFPIRGGDDAGMDGGIADGKGEPFPLVCTTAKDVSGNLRKNLRTYKSKGGPRRKVALATSRELTGKKVQYLFKVAREEGFELIGLYDRHAMKDHLYDNPDWCLKLLGLTGTPSALSTVPRTNRPSPELNLVGRDADLEWLRSTDGDRLLVGQPGSGKTYLLRALVRQGKGLFLVDDHKTAIANAVREERPEVIIVDDAHRDPKILEDLRQLREELRQEQEVSIFSIVATCWPGGEDQIRAAMGTLEKRQVRHLELMIRKEILAIIEQLLPGWNEELLRILVDQASNKPGIAVTLAWLCLRGDWPDVVGGSALWSTLEPTFRELVGPEATDFLAVVSLGGKGGVALDTIGDFLGSGRQKVREMAIGLAAGGVLRELGDRRLVVEPEDLRSALIRRTFFEGVAALSYQELLDKVFDRDAAIREIVRAAHRGARISAHDLRELAQSTKDRDVWRGMAAFRDHAEWALENAPFDAVSLAGEALQHVPRMVIQFLLGRANSQPESLSSRENYPFQIFQTWLQEVTSPAELVARRRQVIAGVQSFVQHGGDRTVAVRAACLALRLEIRGTKRTPLGDGVRISSGMLPASMIEEVALLWSSLLELIHDLDRPVWQPLQEMIQEWIWPSTVQRASEQEEKAHALAATALQDLAPLARHRQGMSAEIRRLARRIDIDIGIEIDPVFQLLYLDDYEDLGDGDRREEERRRAVTTLADAWAVERNPLDAARDLVRYDQESAWTQNNYGIWAGRFCGLLARKVESPIAWLEAFLGEPSPAAFILPFLEKIAEERPEDWEALVEGCFHHEDRVGIATQVVLSLSSPPENLFQLALSNISEWPTLAERLASLGELSASTLLALLQHSDANVALRAAIGEWDAEPRGSIRSEVQAVWRLAVLRSAEESQEENYGLRKILIHDSDLAFEWVRRRLGNGDVEYPDRDTMEVVMNTDLDDRQRLALLDQVQSDYMASAVFPWLVGRRLEVYRDLLDREHLKEFHLYPLRTTLDDQWIEMALVALDHGYEPRAIVEQPFSTEHSFVGRGAWRPLDDAFAALEEHTDLRLREIARIGRAQVQDWIRVEDRFQRHYDLAGLL